MTWDFAEVNFFSESVGSIETVLKTLSAPLTYLSPSGTWARTEPTQTVDNAGDMVVSTRSSLI